MRRITLNLLVALFTMVIPTVTMAQNKYRCSTFELKKHQFGFGITTNLFDNVRIFNHYLSEVGHGGDHFNVKTVQSSVFALHFDYQYRFNDNWSVEAMLRYKHRHTNQIFSFVYEGTNTIGIVGGLNSVYRDIAIPITANYRWVTPVGSSFELFAGVGLTTLGLSVERPATFGISDMQDTRATVGIDYDRSVDAYGVVGFQFEIPFGSFSVKPFFSFSYNPITNAHYIITPIEPTNCIPNKTRSGSMNICELECGLTMQF